MDVVICVPASAPQTPALHCSDAVHALGKTAEVRAVNSVGEIDECLDHVLENKRPPAKTTTLSGNTRLIIAGDDAFIASVVKRAVRRYSPPGRERPADLPEGRTVYDLPAVGILPLESDSQQAGRAPHLVHALDLPSEPEKVAAVVVGGTARRLDLLRSSGGGVTLHGAMLGSAASDGRPLPWQGRIAVDGAVVTDGSQQLLAAAIVNASGYSSLSSLPLVSHVDPSDGLVSVGVALAPSNGEFEVRRVTGRAVEIAPAEGGVDVTDDGRDARLNHTQSWWVEPGAWGVWG